MARGSSKPGGGSSSGSAGGSTDATPVLGESGSVQNTGRYTIRKKFVTTQASGLTQPPQGATPPSFRPVAVSWQQLGGGAYEQTVDYEYYADSATSQVIEDLGGVKGRFELDAQDELVPIAAHPNIRKLIEKYKGVTDKDTGKVTFPVTYKPVGSNTLKTNPMAGKLYFTKPAATFRHIQQTQNIPGGIWDNVGKKISNLPAGFPNPPAFQNENGEEVKYFWVVLSPQIYRRGNAYEVVRSYKLSEPNAPNELYLLTAPATNT